MSDDFEYEVHLISFASRKNGNAYSCVCKDYANLQEWHIPIFEKFLEEMKHQLTLPLEERRGYAERLREYERKREQLLKKETISSLTLDDLLG